MKILLLKDVYNLGRAGDIKKVANGYGRNYLIPQGLAALATEGAMMQADRIRQSADVRRSVLNEEMAEVADQLKEVQLLFPAKAGETGKLYGSVTTAMIAEELTEKIKVEIDKRQIASQPLRLLGMHEVKIRLTLDLIPEISVVVYREGEAPENYMILAEELAGNIVETVEDETDVEETGEVLAEIEEGESETATGSNGEEADEISDEVEEAASEEEDAESDSESDDEEADEVSVEVEEAASEEGDAETTTESDDEEADEVSAEVEEAASEEGDAESDSE